MGHRKFATLLGVLLCAAAGYAGPFSGQVIGTWDTPVTSGCYILTNHSLQCVDNSSSAVYAFSGPTNNVVQWGDFPQTSPPPFSQITFTGSTLLGVPSDTEVVLGTLEYSNGTSGSNTFIFGATLHLSIQGEPTVDPLNAEFSFVTTINGGVCAPCDADYLQVTNVSLDKTLNVYEGGNGTFQVLGKIVGDPHMFITDFKLDPSHLIT